MAQRRVKTNRVEARIASEALELIRRAAEITGRSVSDFIGAAAQEKAYKTIEEERIIRLSLADQQRFIDSLLNPIPHSEAMERAKEAHTMLIRESK
jgi:uncharacterized protein (DUF1778 family)